jgi:hypothetical protein
MAGMGSFGELAAAPIGARAQTDRNATGTSPYEPKAFMRSAWPGGRLQALAIPLDSDASVKKSSPRKKNAGIGSCGVRMRTISRTAKWLRARRGCITLAG